MDRIIEMNAMDILREIVLWRKSILIRKHVLKKAFCSLAVLLEVQVQKH